MHGPPVRRTLHVRVSRETLCGSDRCATHGYGLALELSVGQGEATKIRWCQENGILLARPSLT
ncbi:uncharacterized protein QC763_0082650 [Podospora pseudopauciseta]|uniref:Uncharacterized protein n=1 Tax=Podospora pseudopauciseta TaxID=2093780 RepID=A0ABR0H886_9PEZI|nr:hypothetical protein QC763_0082650 [Podospora pseudopauciseta]